MKSQYEYERSIFEFAAYRKHILTDLRYYASLLPNFLILSTKKNDPNPKYVIPLQLTISIGWVIEKKNNSNFFKAFTIKYFDNYKDFEGSDQDLQKLKDLLRNQVTFYKIADFYEAQYNLGKGSSAKVIQIKELQGENRKLAAKAIDKQYLQKGEQGMFSLLSEVQLLNQLSKLSVGPFIRLYETFEGDKTFYLIMDLMKGRTLTEEIEIYNQKKELLPPKIIKQIMKQLLEGIKILHENHIIHRDLKPDNIMFKTQDSFDELTIVDFGLATSTDVVKYTFPKCGTPGYVAPEILNLVDRDYKYEKVCDVFSCGCIFYKMLTGCSLFYGNTFNEILRVNKLCNINYDNLNLLNISDDALILLKGMLQKNPLERLTAKLALDCDYFKTSMSPTQSQKKQIEKKHLTLEFDHKNIFIPTETDSSEAMSPFQKTIFRHRHGDYDDDITENKGEIIQIRQMPSVKKPTYIKQQIDSSIGSFYAKDPLSSFKKLKMSQKDSPLQNKNQCQVDQDDTCQMQQISLFKQIRKFSEQQ